MSDTSPWDQFPRRTIACFLLAVFFIFSSIGFVDDMFGLGREPKLKFGLSVLLSGLFAVCYSVAGITLRRKFWLALAPIFAVQFVVMGAVGHWLPDAPSPSALDAGALHRLSSRLVFDGVCTIVAVSLGYAGLAYVSISEAHRFAKTRAEKALLESEMAAAREVQQVILPELRGTFPGFTVESVYKPAQQVGGDFYQVLAAENGGLLVVVGDVAGKGLPAAMLVSMLVGSIRSTAGRTHEPADLLSEMHDRLIGRTAGGFSTALVAYVSADGAVTIANAGHLSPYLDGCEVELAGALPLGVANAGHYDVTRLRLEPGSRLTFLSDGVVEAQGKDGELFGFERARAISMRPAAEIVEQAVRHGQADDITVVTIKRVA